MSWKKRAVAVTGGAGFIGSHLVESLVQLGADVTVIDNFERGDMKNILSYSESIKYIKGDLTDFDFAANALKGSETVFDLAGKLGGIEFLAQYPATIIKTNLQMTLNVIEAARINEVDKFLYMSSSCVYGNETPVPHHECDAAYYPPESAYGWSKLSGEAIVKAYNTQYGMNTYVVRPFNVYGPRENLNQSPHVIPQFIKSIFEGNSIIIHGDGEQTRPFTYVTDIVDGTIRTIESKHVFTPFNLGSSEETSINTLARLIMELCKCESQVIVRHKSAVKGDIRRRVADSKLALELLGWTPRVRLKAGLEKTIEWYRAVYRNV